MALSTGFTVIILNIHHSGAYNKPVPTWLRKLVLDWLAKVLVLRDVIVRNESVHSKVRVSEILSAAVYEGYEDNISPFS